MYLLDCNVHLVDRGRGPPVLFLHGNPDSSGVWTPIIDRLETAHRCLAPDFPGFGRSTAPDNFDYSLEGLATFTDAIYSSLGLAEPVFVVGHDFGGMAAAAWTSKFPSKVRELALSNTAFSSDYRWHLWARVWRTPVLGEISMFLMNRALFGRELRRGSPRLSEYHIDEVYRSVSPASKRAILRLYRAVRRESVAGWEQRFAAVAIGIPVIVLWGERDPYIPDAFADRLHARKVVRFPSAGHWVCVVEAQRFADELIAFLDGSAT